MTEPMTEHVRERPAGDVTIEPMTAAHIDLLLPYEHEMFSTEAWTAGMYREELRDRRHRWYIVAMRDGALLGWAGLLALYETAQVLTIGVIPAAQRRGLGTVLLTELTDEARRRQAEELLLEVRVDNEAAIALYRKHNFTRLGIRKGYYANGRVDALTMRKALT